MPFEVALDRLHTRAWRAPWLHPFAAFCRLALALGFVAPGLTKVLGHRFAYWATDTPAGYYFDAIYRTGAYYRFIGVAQVVAGLLLLNRRTAALGAVLYFPIILNIFALTAALGFTEFRFTVVDTGLMLLACLFLLCWEYPRWKGLLFGAGPVPVTAAPRTDGAAAVTAWWLAAFGGFGYTGFLRGLIPPGPAAVASLTLLAGGALLGAWVWGTRALAQRRQPTRAA